MESKGNRLSERVGVVSNRYARQTLIPFTDAHVIRILSDAYWHFLLLYQDRFNEFKFCNLWLGKKNRAISVPTLVINEPIRNHEAIQKLDK